MGGETAGSDTGGGGFNRNTFQNSTYMIWRKIKVFIVLFLYKFVCVLLFSVSSISANRPVPTSGRERKEGWVGVVEKEEEGKAGGEKERDDGKGKGLEMNGRRNQKHLSFPPFLPEREVLILMQSLGRGRKRIKNKIKTTLLLCGNGRTEISSSLEGNQSGFRGFNLTEKKILQTVFASLLQNH